MAPFDGSTFVDFTEPIEDYGRDEVFAASLLLEVPERVVFPAGFFVSIVSIYPLRLVMVVLSVVIVS